MSTVASPALRQRRIIAPLDPILRIGGTSRQELTPWRKQNFFSRVKHSAWQRLRCCSSWSQHHQRPKKKSTPSITPNSLVCDLLAYSDWNSSRETFPNFWRWERGTSPPSAGDELVCFTRIQACAPDKSVATNADPAHVVRSIRISLADLRLAVLSALAPLYRWAGCRWSFPTATGAKSGAPKL